MLGDDKLERVKQLVKLVEKHDLAELTVEENGVAISVKGIAPEVKVEALRPAETVIRVEEECLHLPDEPEAEMDEPSDDTTNIESPMIGVFYRSASPDSPAFVEEGDVIEIGQTVGLIEAMKVFSEIPSEVAGEVVSIPAENGKLVQQGEPLIVVRTP